MAYSRLRENRFLLANSGVALLVIAGLSVTLALALNIPGYAWAIVGPGIALFGLFVSERYLSPIVNRLMADSRVYYGACPWIGVEDRELKNGVRVRIITLTDKESANSLRQGLMRALVRAIREASESVLVIRGSGTAFCGGLHMGELYQAFTEESGSKEFLMLFVEVIKTLAKHPRTVSIVQGNAAAGGVALACCADMVVAHPSVTFRIPGAKGTEDAYRPLARILIPILENRRGMTPRPPEDWFGWRFNASEGKDANLIDETKDEADLGELIEFAVAKLSEKTHKDVLGDPSVISKVMVAVTAAISFENRTDLRKHLKIQFGEPRLRRSVLVNH